jgi:hypothetical protein
MHPSKLIGPTVISKRLTLFFMERRTNCLTVLANYVQLNTKFKKSSTTNATIKSGI